MLWPFIGLLGSKRRIELEMVGDYTENSLVEQPAIALLSELGWETANCFYESFGDSPSPASSPTGRGINLGRETSYDVVLEPKLRVVLRTTVPGLTDGKLNGPRVFSPIS